LDQAESVDPWVVDKRFESLVFQLPVWPHVAESLFDQEGSSPFWIESEVPPQDTIRIKFPEKPTGNRGPVLDHITRDICQRYTPLKTPREGQNVPTALNRARKRAASEGHDIVQDSQPIGNALRSLMDERIREDMVGLVAPIIESEIVAHSVLDLEVDNTPREFPA